MFQVQPRVAAWVIWLTPVVAALITMFWRRQHDSHYDGAAR